MVASWDEQRFVRRVISLACRASRNAGGQVRSLRSLLDSCISALLLVALRSLMGVAFWSGRSFARRVTLLALSGKQKRCLRPTLRQMPCFARFALCAQTSDVARLFASSCRVAFGPNHPFTPFASTSTFHDWPCRSCVALARPYILFSRRWRDAPCSSLKR